VRPYSPGYNSAQNGSELGRIAQGAMKVFDPAQKIREFSAGRIVMMSDRSVVQIYSAKWD
jgi:hypothetical protein